MSDKRISALTEQTGLNTGDFFAVDNAGETESKKIDQAYFSGQYSDMNNILGSKNLMPNNAVTVVLRGVTWTINSDGTIKANGTASGGDSTLYYVSSSNDSTEGVTIPAGKYTYTCLTSAGSDTTFRSEIYNLTNPARIGWDYGEGVTFTRTAATKVLGSINIKSGQTVTNEIFKPMLRPAAVADPTYVPYAKSNKELTEDVASLNASLPKYDTIKLGQMSTSSATQTFQVDYNKDNAELVKFGFANNNSDNAPNSWMLCHYQVALDMIPNGIRCNRSQTSVFGNTYLWVTVRKL